jgi:hypothetical protein
MPYANWLGMRCMMYGSLVAVMLMLHPCKPAKFGLFYFRLFCTPSVSKYLPSLIFFYNFDHSSYLKNCASANYFVCYMFGVVCILNFAYRFTYLR